MKWKTLAIIAVALAYLFVLGIFFMRPGQKEEPKQMKVKISRSDAYETTDTSEPERLNLTISSSLPIAKIEEVDSITITELLDRAAQGDRSVCETAPEYTREACIERYIWERALREQDPQACKEIISIESKTKCMANAAIISVVRAYYNESDQGSLDIVPSNIGLCDQLSGKDRELCLDPKLALEKNYNGIRYELG